MFLDYLYRTAGCRYVTIIHEGCWKVLGTCWGKVQCIKALGKQMTTWHSRKGNPVCLALVSQHRPNTCPSVVWPTNSVEKFPGSLFYVKGEAYHANHDWHIPQRSKPFPRHFLCDASIGQQSYFLTTTVSFLFHDWDLTFFKSGREEFHHILCQIKSFIALFIFF